jgi:hypothetical protein
MAVHITIYPDEPAAAALRQFVAAHSCSPTVAVAILLAQHDGESEWDRRRSPRVLASKDDVPVVEALTATAIGGRERG